MAKRVLFFSALLIPFLLASCSPRPVYRMTPQEESTTFNQGTEYVHLQKNDIELTISYYRHLDGRFVMDVEIVNQTDSVLRVDPTQFSYEAFRDMSGNTPRQSDKPIASRRAIDPERELLHKDLKIAQSEADQKTATLVQAIDQTVYIGASIAADTEQKQEELEEDKERNHYRYQVNQYKHELEQQGLRDQRAVWELEALRKTDLFPGEYIRGYIFFENEPDAFAYFINFSSPKAVFEVFYRQWKYEKNYKE